MARSRKIKRSRKTNKGSSFLPDVLKAFIARRVYDVFTLTVIGIGAFVTAALFTYNHADPSLNTASEVSGGKITNIGGEWGAVVSDVLLQTFGLGAFVISMAVFIWGVRLYKRQSIRPFTIRTAVLLISTIFASISLAGLPLEAIGDLGKTGNAFGVLILEKALSFIDGIGIPKAKVIVVAIAGSIAFGSFLYGAAFKAYEIAALWFRVKVAVYTVAVMIMSVIGGFYGWIMHYNSPEYASEPMYKGLVEKLAVMKEKRALQVRDRAEARMIEQEARERKISKKTEDSSQSKRIILSRKEKDEGEDESKPAEVSSGGAKIPVVKPSLSTAKKPTKPTKSSDNSSGQLFPSSSGEWELPPLGMIQEAPPEIKEQSLDESALRRNAELLRNVLEDFNIRGDVVSINPGPVVTLYELEPAPGTKTSRVISLSDDIARSMSAISVRCAVVPGRNVIGIELPNKKRQMVYMKDMLQSRMYEKTSAKLPLILGKDIGGQPILADLAKMPHLLVAGTTGSGKSVAVNTMIMSLLYRLSPDKCRFIMIDPKMLELSSYADIPHLLSPVVTEPGKAVVALKWAVKEMEDRYRNMSKLGVRNIEGYNQRIRDAIKKGEQIMHKVQTGFDPDTGKATFEDRELELVELPYIVIIVDEFADLMLVAGKDVENAIQRLAQMARAAGLHIIMATQRPSVDVISGVIRANFPTRISFQVTTKIDSRTILGDSGAEQLLGMGDMLYMAPGGRVTRVHGPFVSDEDVEKVTSFLRAQGKPAYLDDITSDEGDFGGSEIMNAMFGDSSGDDAVDELYDKAVAVITREGKVSTSFIQRHLQIGYNRAARIVEEMERQGVISPANSAGKRQILVSDHSGA